MAETSENTKSQNIAVSEEEQIMVFQCQKCKSKYYSPPTRCKKPNCASIQFVQITSSKSTDLSVHSGF